MSWVSKMLPVYDSDIEEEVLLCEEKFTFTRIMRGEFGKNTKYANTRMCAHRADERCFDNGSPST